MINGGSLRSGGTTPPPQGGPAALLFAMMFPQATLILLSLAPPIMAGAVTHSYGLPAEITGAYSGLVSPSSSWATCSRRR
ncbi:hypothetical protein MKL09_11460 [Methylobacterium sp. J-048]|uniref:hypothetical protein n=1 Tax=Methylobacterium sp. J-048 TaxID=2836635 RepID=UPI001FB883FD|nr:hypothetical protein [Methylobacterium sp. J-048]MCJ2057171.1 hypothetical protein [Methylobacterium sp. J-048]